MARNVLINKRCKNRRYDCTCCGGRSGATHPRASKHKTTGKGRKCLSDDGLNTHPGQSSSRVSIPSCRLDSDNFAEGQDTVPSSDGCETCNSVSNLSVDHSTGLLYCDECWAEWGVVVKPDKGRATDGNSRTRPPRNPVEAGNRVLRHICHKRLYVLTPPSVVEFVFGICREEPSKHPNYYQGKPPQSPSPVFRQIAMAAPPQARL